MRTLVFGILFASVNGLLLGLLAAGNSGIPGIALGALAAVFNLVVGIRLGHNAIAAYLNDVARLNRYLADQNESLVLSNRELLERLTAEPADEAAEGEEHRQARTSA